MLQKQPSAVILSFSQSHYFYGELRPVPLLHLTYCNHSRMRLPHELAARHLLSPRPALFRVSLTTPPPSAVRGPIGPVSSASGSFGRAGSGGGGEGGRGSAGCFLIETNVSLSAGRAVSSCLGVMTQHLSDVIRSTLQEGDFSSSAGDCGAGVT